MVYLSLIDCVQGLGLLELQAAAVQVKYLMWW